MQTVYDKYANQRKPNSSLMLTIISTARIVGDRKAD